MPHSSRVLLVALGVALTPTAFAKDGFYIGFNFGGGITSGDTNIPMKDKTLDPDQAFSNTAELFRTDAGTGFSGELRIGYNILGFVAIEADLGGSFENLSDNDKFGTNFGVFGLVRFFPAQLFEEVADRWWDPYVFVGGGAHAVVYKPDARIDGGKMTNKARAWWPSAAVKYGVGCDFYPIDFMSLGLDFAFTNGFHDEFVIDFEDDITANAASDAGSLNVQISASLLFHFGL